MLDFVLTAGIAYGISYWVSSTGLAYWRPIVGFMLAFFAAFLVVIGLAASGTDGTNSLRFMGTGFWYALGGAGFGVYRARYKLRTGQNAPALKFPQWIAFSALALFVIGIVAAVALPAYQDYTKRIQNSAGVAAAPPADKPDATNPFGKPEVVAGVAAINGPNPFDQFDPSTARPVDDAKNRTFTYEQAIAPKSQIADEQEHLRRIYAAHPDADAIHDSPGFKAWVAKYPAYQRILSKGSTQEIIEMFTAYKNQR
jgi:hypothetical protein